MTRKAITKRIASIDLHCDTLLSLYRSGDAASLYRNDFHVDLQKMESGGTDTQFFAVFVPPEEKQPLQMCLDIIDRFYLELDRFSDTIAFAGSAFDIEKNRIAGKKSAFLSLEDSGTIGSRLSNLRLLHRLGVRLVTLTWNHRNPAGSPNIDPITSSEGLTEQGFEFIHEMKRLGMLIDVSHLSDAGFWDISRTIDIPFVASHSNARSVTYHHRNLTDEMIRSISEHGGVIGVNFYAPFLSTERDDKSATVSKSKSCYRFDDKNGNMTDMPDANRDVISTA
ncbi:MAG: dipeptidase, partial [Eubacteriales bacterium]